MKVVNFKTGALICMTALPLVLTAPAQAQTASGGKAPDEAENVTEADIVVTAQKRDQLLLDVPVSVSAVSSEVLVKQNLIRLEDFATRVPGLSVASDRAYAIAIRGINAGGATSPTVATTIDDVPFGTTSWAGSSRIPNLDPSDLQQIEVLRGPQGTLYGASSLGGLIKYVTRPPDPNNFSARAQADVSKPDGGSWGYGLRGAVNVPVINDMLGVRVSGFKRWDPRLGDQYNSATKALTAENINKNDVEGFRAAAFFRPFDALKINVSHLEQTGEFTNSALTIIDRTKPLFTPLYDYFGNDSSPSFGKTSTRLTEARAALDLGSVTLTSISGWTKMDSRLNTDSTRGFSFVLTGLPADAFFPGQPAIAPVYPAAPADAQVRITDNQKTTKFSQEVRLASNGDGPIEWLIGGFYTNERSMLDQEVYVAEADGTRVGSVVIFPLPSTYKEWAGFGDLTYHVSEKLSVQVGARYSKNKQTYTPAQTVSPSASPLLFGVSTAGTLTQSQDSSFTWLITPSYKLTPDTMIYARVATGYRPGGPNTASAPQTSFGPDRVTNYELGLKGQFFGKMLTVDTSLFQIDWKNVQLQAQTAAQIPYFTNAGKARSRGWEAALNLKPAAGWSFNGNVSLIDAELRDDLPILPSPAPSLLGKRGDPLPFVAKFSSNLGFEKRFPVGDDAEAWIGGNWNHVGQRDTFYRSNRALPAARQAKLRLPAYDVVDLQAGLDIGKWSATFFVRNLLNERGIRDAGDGQGTSSTMTASYIQPRTMGLSFTVSY